MPFAAHGNITAGRQRAISRTSEKQPVSPVKPFRSEGLFPVKSKSWQWAESPAQRLPSVVVVIVG